MEEEIQGKNINNDYSAIKDPIEDKLQECTNLLLPNEKINTNNSNTFKNPENKKPYNYGKNKILLFRNGEPYIVLGPHWPFFICLFTIIVMFLIPFMIFVWSRLNPVGQILGIGIISVQIISYLITVFSNPGFPKRFNQSEISNIEQGKALQQCKKCLFIIEPGQGTFHCYECDVCIEGYDHHCPWTAKCIGKNNLVSFYFFISFTTFLFGYLILSLSLIDT